MPGSALLVAPDFDSEVVAGPLEIEDLTPPPSDPTVGRLVTALLVCAPFLGLGLLLLFGWNHLIGLGDLTLALVMYLFTGFGIAAGFHRLFTHRSFKANRILKVTLAVAGSMALEGALISWVAIHRRHHMFSDQPDDPHSPSRYGSQPPQRFRGFLWAHTGWLFADDPTDTKRFAPDLLKDRDLVVVDRLFPVLAIVSLAIPFAIGWFIWGTLAAAFGAFFWAGLVRVGLLHHVTWSINSVCHLWGQRPFATSDSSGNVGTLAVISFGESWHNFHHSAPASARHGALPHQFDPAARLIRWFEIAGWATKVRWPTSTQIDRLMIKGPSDSGQLVAQAGERVLASSAVELGE